MITRRSVLLAIGVGLLFARQVSHGQATATLGSPADWSTRKST
jgi:hypothetical protein